MGIFGFKNKYDIVPKKEFTSIVTKYQNVSVLKINARLVVPSRYLFIIGKKGKVCDKFDEGEHYFSYSNLPLMCRRYKIDKIKNNKQQDKIPVDFYFVSKNLMAGQFATYRKVNMGTKAYGLFSTHVYGVYSYTVENGSEYMQSLLNEYDYIKTGEAEHILENWVNDIVVEELEKQNFILKDVVENNPIIAEALKVKVSKLFSIIGLKLHEFKITKYKLPKKYQLDSDQNIQNQQTISVDDENQQNKDNSNTPEESYNNLDDSCSENIKDNQQKNEPAENQKKSNFIEKRNSLFSGIEEDLKYAQSLLNEFGIGDDNVNKAKDQPAETDTTKQEQEKLNTATENILEDSKLQINKTPINSQESKKADYIPFGNFVIEDQTKSTSKEKTFVDLSLDGLYNGKSNLKRCLNCGMENDSNADHCIICGEKFNKGE